MRSLRPSRPRVEGFSLLELMVVVAIIGITAAIAAPAVGRAIASSRADRAVHDIVRLGRRARSESVAFGRAYLLRPTATGLQLWRGTTPGCRLNAWPVLTAAGNCVPPAAPAGNCADYMDTTSYVADPYTLTLAQTGGTNEMCFQPNGEMLVRPVGSAGAFAFPAQDVLTITALLTSPAGADPLRGAVFPSAGAPRTMR